MTTKLLSGGDPSTRSKFPRSSGLRASKLRTPPRIVRDLKRARVFRNLITRVCENIASDEFLTLRISITDKDGTIIKMGKWTELPVPRNEGTQRRQL